MKKVLSWLIGLPVAVVVVALAVANRQKVTFSIDPFSRTDPLYTIEAPLFLLMLAAVFVGIICGGIASWLSQGKWRRAAKEARAEGTRLKQEREALKREAAEAQSKLLTSSAPPSGG